MTVMSKKKAGKAEDFRLDRIDMDKKLHKETYLERLEQQQLLLRQIQQAYLATGDRAVIVFEGWDAGGKGGTIRRMSAVMDPRGFKVWPIAAPRNFHKERHFLYRFWERVPPVGAISVFDRSWYGRVLVERVERLTPEEDWRRGYREIIEFERMLHDDGARIVKIFMHITPEEQLRRFEQRLTDPMKRWKLTYEDFRNRDRRPDYEVAVEEMVARTSSEFAPWHVIPANNKKYARIKALSLITATLGKGVDLGPPPMDEAAKAQAREVFGRLPEDL